MNLKLKTNSKIRDIAWEMFRLIDNIEGEPFKETLKLIKPIK